MLRGVPWVDWTEVLRLEVVFLMSLFSESVHWINTLLESRAISRVNGDRILDVLRSSPVHGREGLRVHLSSLICCSLSVIIGPVELMRCLSLVLALALLLRSAL